MNVIVFGATGMVGQAMLAQCLVDPGITLVLVIGRTPVGLEHEKMREILHQDFFDFSALADDFTGIDACFFCLGVSSVGKKEPEYRRITHDITLAAAQVLVEVSPDAVFVYVSGTGTDSTEHGRVMWARVKGEVENALLAMPFGPTPYGLVSSRPLAVFSRRPSCTPPCTASPGGSTRSCTRSRLGISSAPTTSLGQ